MICFFAFCASLESRNYRVWKFQANNVAQIYNVLSKKGSPDAYPFYKNEDFVICHLVTSDALSFKVTSHCYCDFACEICNMK